MGAGRGTLRGTLLLLGTTALWGSSFPAIKYTVTRIGPLTYVWIRSLIAVAGLAPYAAYRAARIPPGILRRSLQGGLATGVAYALGLWLQGWGTRYTTASNSAFITGLNVVFVHLYAATRGQGYTPSLAAALLLSIAGLYLLTRPTGGFGIGEALVLLGAVMWAAQVVLVGRYAAESDPAAFTLAEMTPSISLALPALAFEGAPSLSPKLLIVLAYLGLACADLAFALQVAGQKTVPPEVAALIFLLEPVFAAALSAATLGERFTLAQYCGMALIIAGIAVAELSSPMEGGISVKSS